MRDWEVKYIDREAPTEGIKETINKLDYSEINLRLLDIMAKRFMDNKSKYPKGNSKKPIDKEILTWATFRHIRKILQPIKDDKESVEDHLAAIGCNISMILDQIDLSQEKL